MAEPAQAIESKATRTRGRILTAAQVIFSRRGYGEAGFREIAAAAGVTPSLVVKYFGSKAELFREALVAALIGFPLTADRKRTFGADLVKAVLDPEHNIVAPAMIALALGDAEAKRVTIQVVRETVIGPMGDWIGGADGRSRAANVLALSIGFAILERHLEIDDESDRSATSRWVASAIGEMIERSPTK